MTHYPATRLFSALNFLSALRFREAAAAHSLDVEAADTGPEGATFTLRVPESSPEPIFQAAAASSAQVRHLLRKRPSLEEVFQSALLEAR